MRTQSREYGPSLDLAEGKDADPYREDNGEGSSWGVPGAAAHTVDRRLRQILINGGGGTGVGELQVKRKSV